MKNRTTRREMMKTAAAAMAAPYVITSAALGADDKDAASERIVVGGIGIGNMGRGDHGAFLGRKDVQYVAVCDVKKGVREGAKKKTDQRYGNSDCKAYVDYRELIDRDDIDAVHIATPDHWHSVIIVDACRHGKDVFCQKPETLTLGDGPAIIDAAKKYARVVSGGSQRVLQDYRGIVNPCWEGKKGKIKSINVNVGPLSRPCNLEGQKVPDGFDWNMWLGPAPWAPYHPFRCSGSFSINGKSWRSFSDYSGGGMTDWGAHHFGGATFAVDVRELEPTEVIFHKDKKDYLTFQFPNGIQIHHNHPGQGNMHVIGSDETKEPKKVPSYKGTGGICGDFIHCVKTREKPFRDVEFAVHTMTVCHLGSIAHKLQRSLKWDTEKQDFVDDDEASRMRQRPMRQPFSLNS